MLKKFVIYMGILLLAVPLQTRQWNKTRYFIDCGINFVHQSLKVTIRDSLLPGTEWPAELNIAGLPEECMQVKAAYLWWTQSYRDEADSESIVLVNNPLESKAYYNADIIGSDIGKCWNDFGEKGTRAYVVDITKSISGNGKYEIGINKSYEEIDGITLLIVYRDLKAAYQGNLFISDGLITMQRKDTNVTLNDLFVCDTSLPGSAKALLVMSDLQPSKTDSGSVIEINGAPYNIKRKFWNSEIFPAGKFSPGTKTVDFKVNTDDDCYSLVMNGLYFQTGEKCKLCPERLKFSLKEDTNNVCEGTVVTITAKGAPRYVWSDINGVFSTDSIVKVTPPKGGMFYNVRALSEDGCTEGSNSILINVFERPRANAGKDTTVCMGSFVRIGAAKQSNYLYKWEPDSGLSSPNVSNPFASPEKTTAYTLTVSNNFGCFSFDTITVTVVPALSADHPDTINSCPGKPVRLDANISSGTKPYTYFWQPDDLFPNSAEPVQEVSLLKSRQAYLTVTDGRACVLTDTFFIEIKSDIMASAGNDTTICPGSSAVIGGYIEGGEPPYQLLWAPDRGLSSVNVLRPVASPDTTTTYFLGISDNRGCYAFDTIKVTVGNPMISDYQDTITTCVGEEAFFKGRISGGQKPYSYFWEPQSGLSSPVAAEPSVILNSSAKFFLTVTDSLGCPEYDTVYVKVNDNPFYDLGGDAELCRGSEIIIGTVVTGGRPPYTVEWFPDKGLDRTDTSFVIASPNVTTKYYMKVTDFNNCTFIDSITVAVKDTPQPAITARGNARLCKCDSLLIECESEYESYSWQDGSQKRSIYAKSSGDYNVVVTDSNGCSGVSNTIKVEIINPVIEISLPEQILTKTGEHIEIPVDIKYSEELINCGKRDFSGALAFNKTLLLPTAPTTMGYTDGNYRFVPFLGEVNTNGDTRLVFSFTSALGNAAETQVYVSGLKFDDCIYGYNTNNSSVVITDVCFDGGEPRLFLTDSSPVVYSINPAPAGNVLLIGVDSPGNRQLMITINNILGTPVLENSIRAVEGNNIYTIDISGIAPGLYFLCTKGSFDNNCREIIIIR